MDPFFIALIIGAICSGVVTAVVWFVWKFTTSEEILPDKTEKYFTEQEHERSLPNHNMEGGDAHEK
jgi:heme/copper-type cytochrome/quinol oxidase subunit 2